MAFNLEISMDELKQGYLQAIEKCYNYIQCIDADVQGLQVKWEAV